MAERTDNYKLQAQQATRHFLTYDQQELVRRCRLDYDETYLYTRLLSQPYRIHRETGRMERREGDIWEESCSFHEIMTLLDWLCDSRPDRRLSGRWSNIVTRGYCFHRNLQEEENDPTAALFDQDPKGFAAACEALGGEIMPGGDIGYAIELLDGLRIYVQFWHGDEEFAPRLRCLWDENVEQYLRYETTWYATALLRQRLKEHMPQKQTTLPHKHKRKLIL